jgi:hypothetical protein
MSGRPAPSLHQSIKRARARLVLISLSGWGLLFAASFVMHSHDGQWGLLHPIVIASHG